MAATISYIALLIFWFLATYIAAKHFSGNNFKLTSFYSITALSIAWGSIQLGLARDGLILFVDDPIDTFKDDQIVRWAALVSVFMQTVCIPSKEPFRAWL